MTDRSPSAPVDKSRGTVQPIQLPLALLPILSSRRLLPEDDLDTDEIDAWENYERELRDDGCDD